MAQEGRKGLLDLPPELTRIIWTMLEPDIIDLALPKSDYFHIYYESVRRLISQMAGVSLPFLYEHPYAEYQLALNVLATHPDGLSYWNATISNVTAPPVLLVCRRFYEEAHTMHRPKIHITIPSPLVIPVMELLSVKRRNFISTINIDSQSMTPHYYVAHDIARFIRQLACLTKRQLSGYIARRLGKVYDRVTIVHAAVEEGRLQASADVSNTEEENKWVKKWKNAEDAEKNKAKKVTEGSAPEEGGSTRIKL